MLSRNKETKDRPRKAGGMPQFMPFDMPDVNEFDATMPVDGDDDGGDDDSDLEAELLQLTSGNAQPPTRRTARPARPAAVPVPPESLEEMVGAILRDTPTDEEVSGDDDDPELLNELGTLVEEESTAAPEPPPAKQTTPSKPYGLVHDLEERLNMYREAEKNAKEAGETLRAKRFGRGIKTLLDLIKQAKAGRNVNEEDIPPPVVVKMTKKVDPAPAPEEPTPDLAPKRPAPPPPVTVKPTNMEVTLPEGNESSVKEGPSTESQKEKSATIAALVARRDEYKIAALQAKKSGDRETAVDYVKIVKKFEIVISAVENGEIVDLSEMPPPPPPLQSVKTAPSVKVTAVEESEKQKESDNAQSSGSGPEEGETQPESDLYSAPSAPATILEALVQRLEKYKSVEKAAQEEGNGSKARRIGRIVKQYENAIKLHKAGKPIPIDELPTPPGFAPIPQEEGSSATSKVPSAPPTQPAAQDDAQEPAPSLKPACVPRPQPSPTPSPRPQQNVCKTPESRQEKQMALLLERQKQFKEAAIEAIRKGEIGQAREYLRTAKGFDRLIEATNSGLPVDMETVPVLTEIKAVVDSYFALDFEPDSESDFDIVEIDDYEPSEDSKKFTFIEKALLKQIKTCIEHRDHCKITGDIANMKRFEQLAAQCKEDLAAVHLAHKQRDSIPKFHFETKVFTLVEYYPELGDNDLELHIIRGLGYKKAMDTYVKFQFPYPNDYPQKERTGVVRDTNCPMYDQKFMLTFERNSRECQRVFKRKSIKCEVYSRGGFFRADVLIGTVNIKLQQLESKCNYLECFELMNGRKKVGGHLEVGIKIRSPLVSKQIKNLPEKWMVIDSS